MGDVTISGERQAPDIFFIMPTGKGGNISAPHRKDYSADILEPVVKPWLEKDQMIGPLAVRASVSEPVDWKAALAEPPPPAPAPEAPIAAPVRSQVGLPPAATSRPPPPPPAAIPPAVLSRPSAPPAAGPPPAAPPPSVSSEGVPILVPSQ
jgi:hypothetical protein